MVRLQIGAVTCCAMLAGLLLPAASLAAGRDVPRTTVLTGAGLKVTWPLASGSAVVAPGTTLTVGVRPTSTARDRTARIALARLDAAGRTVAMVKTATVRRGTFAVRVPRSAGGRYALTLRAGPLRRTSRFRTPAPVRPVPVAPGVAVDAQEDALPPTAHPSTPAAEPPTGPERIEADPVDAPTAAPDDAPAEPPEEDESPPAPEPGATDDTGDVEAPPTPPDNPAVEPSLPELGSGCLASAPSPPSPWPVSGPTGYTPNPLVALRFGSTSAVAGSSVPYAIENLGTSGISFPAGYGWEQRVAGAWVKVPLRIAFPAVMLGVRAGGTWSDRAQTSNVPGRYRLLIGPTNVPSCPTIAAEIDLTAPAP